MRICIATCLILVLFACDGDRFEFELPVNKPRMVVNFVSADSQPWTGTLTLSKPVLELPDFTGVPAATLKIYEDGRLVETVNDASYDPRQGRETTTLSRPTPGKTYTIEASSSGYDVAYATYWQPLPVPIEKFDLKLVGPDAAFDNRDAVEISITFVDPPGENFYGINAVAAWDSVELRGPDYALYFLDPAYENDTERYTYDPGRYFDDKYFEGKRVTMTFKAPAQRMMNSDGSPVIEYQFVYHWVGLRNISKSYYRYLQTIDLQQKNWGDPYAQPVKVETNVKNGFGVVGGWTRTVKGKSLIY